MSGNNKKSRFVTWLKNDGKSYEYDHKKRSLHEEYLDLKASNRDLSDKEKKMIQLYEMVKTIEATEVRYDKMMSHRKYANLEDLLEQEDKINVDDKVDSVIQALSMAITYLDQVASVIDTETKERISLAVDEINKIINH